MPQRILRFRIRQDGRVEETVEGALGSSCIKLTENLEAALGSLEKRRPTSDSYLSEEAQIQSIPLNIH